MCLLQFTICHERDAQVHARKFTHVVVSEGKECQGLLSGSDAARKIATYKVERSAASKYFALQAIGTFRCNARELALDLIENELYLSDFILEECHPYFKKQQFRMRVNYLARKEIQPSPCLLPCAAIHDFVAILLYKVHR